MPVLVIGTWVSLCPGFVVRESAVRQAASGSCAAGLEFDADYSLHAFSCGGDPCQFDTAVGVELEESSVVWVALACEGGLPKEDPVHLGCHQDGSGHGKPAVHVFCPGTEQHLRRRVHRTFDGELKRPRG